jgi:hypothetical protein
MGKCDDTRMQIQKPTRDPKRLNQPAIATNPTAALDERIQDNFGASSSPPDIVFNEVRSRGMTILVAWPLTLGMAACLALLFFLASHLPSPTFSVVDVVEWWGKTGNDRQSARELLLPVAGVVVALVALPSLSDSPNAHETTERSVQQILFGRLVSIATLGLATGAWLVAPLPIDGRPWVAGFLVCAVVSLFGCATFGITGVARLERQRILSATQERLNRILTQLQDKFKVGPSDRPPALTAFRQSPQLTPRAAPATVLALAGAAPTTWVLGQANLFAGVLAGVVIGLINVVVLDIVIRTHLQSRWHHALGEPRLGRALRVSNIALGGMTAVVMSAFSLPAHNWTVFAAVLSLMSVVFVVYPMCYHCVEPARTTDLYRDFLCNERDNCKRTIAEQQRLLQPVTSTQHSTTPGNLTQRTTASIKRWPHLPYR